MAGETSSYPIYTGFWTNWSYGKVFGSTLTLSRSNSDLLIAFLAFFVTIISSSVWSILCFTFHFWFSSPTPRDALYHQRQAVLHNNSGPVKTAYDLISLWYSWRRTSKVASRIVPLLSICVLLAVGFAAAAGFSSRLGQGSEVLLLGSNCSMFNAKTSISDMTWVAEHMQNSATYAQQCYANFSNSARGSGCTNSRYVKQQIPVSVDSNAPCPFDPSLCAVNSSNLILDTNLMDTHVHFGINAPPNERLQWRRVLECAPLTTLGYSETVDLSTYQSVSYYYYGPTWNVPGNYTYVYPSPSNYLHLLEEIRSEGWMNVGYTFNSYVARFHNGSYTSQGVDSVFEPISGLQRQNADVYLIFLSPNEVEFAQSTSDPWYNSSHTELVLREDAVVSNDSSQYDSGWRMLLAAEPASPLGCVYREQWCIPGLPAQKNCTPLVGTSQMAIELSSLVPDNATWNRINWISGSIIRMQPIICYVIFALGGQSLTSRFDFLGNIQGFVAPDQWQQDVQYWNAITLAGIQQSFISTVMGDVVDTPELSHTYNNEEERVLCSSQKILSSDFVSFSTFGLVLIGILGIVIMILSFSLEPLVVSIQKRCKSNSYASLEWVSTGTLQLQRMAHEGIGLGPWSGCDKSIPTTHQDTLLGILDISQPSYPVLHASSQTKITNKASNQLARIETCNNLTESASHDHEDKSSNRQKRRRYTG